MVSLNLDKYRVILASASPRRQQLLRELGISFDVVLKVYEESYPDSLKGEDIASWVSLQKARTFISELSENDLIITADTIVWCKNQVLGKPENSEEARGMIKTLSGTDHEVITGVTIMSSLKIKTFTETTIVTFEEMTDEEISYYVEKFKPFDKAGAYGIQEWIGLAACTRIEGSYFNVVGMPVHRLYKELKEFVS